MAIIFFVVLTLAFFAVAIVSARYKLGISLKENQLQKLEKELDSYSELEFQIKSEIDTVQKDNEYLQKRILFLRDMSKDAVRWSGVLLVISKLIPHDLWLSKISLNKDEVILRGVTLDNMKVSEFMRSLEKAGCFKFITFNIIQKKKVDNEPLLVDFEIITSLNR